MLMQTAAAATESEPGLPEYAALGKQEAGQSPASTQGKGNTSGVYYNCGNKTQVCVRHYSQSTA